MRRTSMPSATRCLSRFVASRRLKASCIERARYDELLPVMAGQALASGSPANNPRVPTSDEIIELYRRVYE